MLAWNIQALLGVLMCRGQIPKAHPIRVDGQTLSRISAGNRLTCTVDMPILHVP